MKKSRFTDSQILAILKQAEAGSPVPELCRVHGISSATFYKWRSKFGGMDASPKARMKALEVENRRLKTLYVDAQLERGSAEGGVGKNVVTPSQRRGLAAAVVEAERNRSAG